MAHFLEADLRPWSVAIAARLFVPEPTQQPPFLTAAAAAAAVETRAARRESAWQCMEELRPLHGAVDAVLRASEVPLIEQMCCTSAERQPAVIGSRAVAGALELSYSEAAACCDAMHAVRGVHTLTLRMTRNETVEADTHGDDGYLWYDDSSDSYSEGYLYKINDEAEVAVERALSAVPTLPELRSLRLLRDKSLSLPPGIPSCSEVAGALTRLSQLAELKWEGAEDAAAVLGQLTTLTRLRLSIALNQGSERALASGLTRLCRLSDLAITFHGSVDVASITRCLGSLTALTSLQLWESFMGPTNAAVLARSLCLIPQLAVLSLAVSHVGPEGAEALARPLSHLTALEHLNLSWNGTYGDGASMLAPALGRLTRLTLLQLDGNDIGADCAHLVMADVSRLSRLASLSLRANDLGDAGAAALAPALGGLQQLTLLHLGNNDIGADGLQQLAPALAGLTGVKQLGLDLKEVPQSAVEALRARLPASVWEAIEEKG